MSRLGTVWLLAGALLLFLPVSSNAAPDASGRVVAVVQSSQADGVTGRRTLTVEAPVFSGDRILTGGAGEAQVRFRDGTRLVVGPNSSMTIDAFVFNADNTPRQVSVNAVRGAFRFMTGSGNKNAYTITTPTATIGVRGTEFDIAIDETGETSVAVFSGVTLLCDRRRQNCVEQRAGCSLASISAGQQPRRIEEQFERQQRLMRQFRYIRSQQSLLADFRVNTGACLQRAALPSGDTPAMQATPRVVVPGEPPSPSQPPPPVVGSGNRSGLGDGTNPAFSKSKGQGPVTGATRSGNKGTDNPGKKGG